jgi:hypothetical protein
VNTPDQPRMLHRRSEMGYTRSSTQALSLEPEAIDADEQWRMTRAAQDRQMQTWTVARRRLLDEIEHLRVHVQNPHVDRTARALQREINALDRRLAA